MEKDDSKSGSEIVLDNKRLLILLAGLILMCGTFFICGFIKGRRAATKNNVPRPAAPKEFLDPKCNIPFSSSFNNLSFYEMDAQKNHPNPTKVQIVQIRRLLSKDTRIHSIARVDVDPPLVFVLHQPKPRTSSDTELTMFRFKKGGTDSEDLGAYCFIPDFIVDRDGRAIAGWAENSSGGNFWDSSSLETMVIEKGEVSCPEIESESYQVAKDLDLDNGVAVLRTLDTRFEFWEGLCHACSPIQQAIFELNRNGVWVDATSKHLRMVEEWIQEDLKTLKEAKDSNNKNDIGAAALNLYLDAETAGHVARYRKTVKQTLKEIGWERFIKMIDKATRRKCRLIDITDS